MSAMSLPGSVATSAGDFSNVNQHWDNVTLGLDPGTVHAMIQDVLHDNDQEIQSLTKLTETVQKTQAETSANLAGMIETLKSGEGGLVKYMPYVLAAVVLVVSLRR
jgi:hypothetical protein